MEQLKSSEKTNVLKLPNLTEYINIKDVFLASDSEKVALLTKNFLSDLNNKFNLPSEVLSEAANCLYTTQDLNTQRQTFKSATKILKELVKH
tara:strand:- start:37 stop:312 length:276 start_codon:yes stop_codon:yes gene_type:complete